MDPRKINDDYSVAAQIAVEDVQHIAAAGFTTLVCNRPDGEDPGQPTVAEIRAEAEKHQLAFHHIPTRSAAFAGEVVAQHAQVLEAAPGPVFAYCRSGTRCTVLWALAHAGKRPAEELIQQASEAGYDIAALRPQLEA